MPKCDSYVICTSPRSGSTLLCKLLAATGIAGNPDSHFHEPSMESWLDNFDLTVDTARPETEILAKVFRAAVAKGTGGTGIFGLRLQRHSFEFFIRKLTLLHPHQTGDRQRFEAAFGRTLFIHLIRQDKVGQAVSCVKAEQTGLWHMAPDGTELERLAPPAAPVYDAQEIRACYDKFMGFDRDWRSWFETQGIEPLRITYEALSSDASGALREILTRLGVNPAAADGVSPGVAKLADETNRDWAARFRSGEGIA